jgi:hypothetical protein
MTETIRRKGNPMKLGLVAVLAMGLSLTVVRWGWAVEPNAEQKKAVAEVHKLGGKVQIDDKRPGKPVIAVDLRGCNVTDGGLKHLRRLTELQRLNLRDTKVTDAGLKHINGLTRLWMLCLDGTRVTDDGVKHLKGLTQLQELGLERTEVTDAGLEHLKGLKQLSALYLWGTKVTDAGVKELQEALPKCDIRR